MFIDFEEPKKDIGLLIVSWKVMINYLKIIKWVFTDITNYYKIGYFVRSLKEKLSFSTDNLENYFETRDDSR